MALFGQRRLPQIDPALGGTLAQEMPQGPAFNPSTASQRPAQPGKRKVNWGGVAADFLAGLAGQPGPYLAQMQHRQRIEEEEARSERERQQRREEWLFQQQWERANPEPRTNDTVADYEFIRSKLGEEGATKFLQNRADPPRYVQGPDGQFYPVQVAQPPTRPVGRLTPIEGGPGGSPSGAGFRP